MTNSSSASPTTLNDFYVKLTEKVSNYNARLMLQTAMLTSGVQQDKHEALESEQVKAICLALINKGGPAFQVGKSFYQNLQ